MSPNLYVINLWKKIHFTPPAVATQVGSQRVKKMQFVWDSAYHPTCLKQPLTQFQDVKVFAGPGQSMLEDDKKKKKNT